MAEGNSASRGRTAGDIESFFSNSLAVVAIYLAHAIFVFPSAHLLDVTEVGGTVGEPPSVVLPFPPSFTIRFAGSSVVLDFIRLNVLLVNAASGLPSANVVRP